MLKGNGKMGNYLTKYRIGDTVRLRISKVNKKSPMYVPDVPVTIERIVLGGNMYQGTCYDKNHLWYLHIYEFKDEDVDKLLNRKDYRSDNQILCDKVTSDLDSLNEQLDCIIHNINFAKYSIKQIQDNLKIVQQKGD